MGLRHGEHATWPIEHIAWGGYYFRMPCVGVKLFNSLFPAIAYTPCEYDGLCVTMPQLKTTHTEAYRL